MRLNTKGMDARRGAQRMVIPFASLATWQTPFCVQTLRAAHALHAGRCYSPLVWNAKRHGSCLALRAKHGQPGGLEHKRASATLQGLRME